MKTIIFALIISALTLTGCGNKTSSTEEIHDHGDGSTHTHDNGEVHQNHDTAQQQEFTVDQDSVIHEHHDHSGDSTHNHPH